MQCGTTFNAINKKIEKSKLTKQDYLTKCALNKEIVVIEDLQKVFVELKRQDINLNQIARAINNGEINCVAENTLKEYEVIYGNTYGQRPYAQSFYS